ncbi:MAG TPA: hypothetical protein VLA19_13070 [Herpetosiphonaceae bacterium]|nr:hypothetical protein [Herpetosiphonaceae bacterium]
MQKLETVQGKRDTRMFMIEGSTEDERQAYIDALIASGKAVATNTFVYTGVPRQAAGSPPACADVR